MSKKINLIIFKLLKLSILPREGKKITERHILRSRTKIKFKFHKGKIRGSFGIKFEEKAADK